MPLEAGLDFSTVALKCRRLERTADAKRYQARPTEVEFFEGTHLMDTKAGKQGRTTPALPGSIKIPADSGLA